ncbi:MAG: bifunctional heptose 7-phosphate kinase/heptose 1-phosphate adenyltransferase [Candidatus Polarisedimenticolia bacterium]
MKDRLRAIVDRFEGTPVAVVADLVLDEFLYAEIARVSREAPVLIVDHRRLDAMPGGGGNAVQNVRALGGRPIPVGVVGDDEAGHRLVELLESSGIDAHGVARLGGYATPVKTRVLAGLPHSRPQQVVRIDRGSASRVPAEAAGAAAETALGLLERGQVSGIMLSDYGYDLITPASARPLIEHARLRKVPITCDSRQRLKGYAGVTAITPNLEEAEQMAGQKLDDAPGTLAEAGRRMLEKLACRAVLVTRGSRGMTLIEEGVAPFDIPVFGGDQVADVTGAGDTVIAVFTLALSAGATPRAAAMLANCAAGLVVLKRGTATVSGDELRAAIDRLPPGPAA